MGSIQDRINLCARRSSEYNDAWLLSDQTINSIILDEQNYLECIEKLKLEISLLKAQEEE